MSDVHKKSTEQHRADKRFLVEYNYAGSEWMTDLWANDHQDAQRKLRALGTNGRVLGEAMMQVKVPTLLGRFVGWLTRGAKP